MTHTIRTASMADISDLDRLFERSYLRLLAPDYAPSVLMTAAPIISRAQPDLIKSGLFFVVETPEGTIGAAGGWSMNPPGGKPGIRGVGHIRHVATDPDIARGGYGRALLQHILLHAKASGMREMHALSTLTAVPFYEAMGFVSQGEVETTFPGGIKFPSVFMTSIL